MRFIDPHHDAWRAPGPGADATQPAPGRLLTLAQWHAARERWSAGVAVALALPNDADVEAIEPDLGRVAAVVLDFPQWTDGRAYSQARLLRARLRYRGEVRAAGEVLVDMLPLLHRTGFDAVQLRADQSLDSAQRALRFFAGHYQGDVVEPRPLYRRHDAHRTTQVLSK